MLWVLPINILVLVVWVHNLAVHWLTPFSSHHNVLSIMPLLLLVETLTSGKMIPRLNTRYEGPPCLFDTCLWEQLADDHKAYATSPAHYSASLQSTLQS